MNSTGSTTLAGVVSNGALTKAGQGPGEFSPMMGYRPHFSEAGIFVFGGRKVALFDRSGKLLGDRSLRNWCEVPVDDAHFLARDSTVSENKDQVRILNLVGFDMERTETAVELFRAPIGTWGPTTTMSGAATPTSPASSPMWSGTPRSRS